MRFTPVHNVTIAVTLCALFSWSCTNPVTADEVREIVRESQPVSEPVSEPVEDAPAPTPEPEPEPAAEPIPAWQPEPHTVYILDGDGDIYLQSTTDDAEHFRSLVSAWSGAAESYNRKRNKPGPYPYRFVAGEAP